MSFCWVGFIVRLYVGFLNMVAVRQWENIVFSNVRIADQVRSEKMRERKGKEKSVCAL